MFYYSVLYWEPRKYEEKFGPKFNSIRDGIKHLSKFPYFREELEVLIDMRMGVLHQTTVWLDSIGKHGIELYGCYSADEVHIICEDQLKRGIPLGTQYIKKDFCILLFYRKFSVSIFHYTEYFLFVKSFLQKFFSKRENRYDSV